METYHNFPFSVNGNNPQRRSVRFVHIDRPVFLCILCHILLCDQMIFFNSRSVCTNSSPLIGAVNNASNVISTFSLYPSRLIIPFLHKILLRYTSLKYSLKYVEDVTLSSTKNATSGRRTLCRLATEVFVR